jgi:hypothetical protein
MKKVGRLKRRFPRRAASGAKSPKDRPTLKALRREDEAQSTKLAKARGS